MQTCIVLGTHNSGSGLVHEYLSSRSDFNSPFDHNEFRICSDPMGLNYLYTICYKNKGFFNASHSINEFLKYINNLQQNKTYLQKNLRRKIYKNNLNKEAQEFIKKITHVKYYALPHYRRITLSLKEKLILKVNEKIFNKNIPENKITSIILLKNEKIFINEAKKFINKILISNIEKNSSLKKKIVLNNGADIIDPIETSKFYTNPKIIVVTRDPRGIFASMKTRESLATPWYDVNIFIKWYKKCFEKNIYLNKKNPMILKLEFEKIINNFKKENKKICNFLKIKQYASLKKNKYFEFDLLKSKKNINKYQKYLTKFEITQIEKKLKNFLHW